MSTRAEQTLREYRAPDEAGAERRAWAVVRAARLELQPVRKPRSRRGILLAPALAVAAAVVVLSPAGAKVGRIITHALGVANAAHALYSLPAPGRILISGPGGTWVAAGDGSTRHLGSWPAASWSPHGLYVAVASADRLAAVDPRGDVRWAIARPRISDPRWYSPSGYRVAYLSGGTLRVSAGDGTGDRLLASHVASVAPAWRPGQALGPFEVAYATDDNRVVLRDGDTDVVLWTAAAGARPLKLLWSGDGRRLVVLTTYSVRTYAGDGTLLGRSRVAANDAALSPNGRTLALVVNHRQVVVAGRQLFAGAGVKTVSWSPDGRWLLVDWPAADQWVFLRVAGAPRIAAVSHIVQQFSAGHAFPQVEGWCCAAGAPAG
jgi:hypothetical protein